MAKSRSNEAILVLLRHGLAEFELTSSPVPSVSGYRPHKPPLASISVPATSHRFFARIGPSFGGGSPALKKVERYSVQKVTGDGRCLFRALVKGMAFNKGVALSPREEKENAGRSGLMLGRIQMLCPCCCFSTLPSFTSSIEKKESSFYELRMAVKEVICDNDKERLHYEEALIAITVEESLKRYCQRIGRSDFWGGESELLVSVVKAVLPANCCLHTRT